MILLSFYQLSDAIGPRGGKGAQVLSFRTQTNFSRATDQLSTQGINHSFIGVHWGIEVHSLQNRIKMSLIISSITDDLARQKLSGLVQVSD